MPNFNEVLREDEESKIYDYVVEEVDPASMPFMNGYQALLPG